MQDTFNLDESRVIRREDAFAKRAEPPVAATPEPERTRDNPAPLSDALNIPTLVGEKGAEKSTPRDNPAPLSDALHIPTLVDDKPKSVRPPAPPKVQTGFGETEGPIETNRATTPAAPPRADAASWVGVPSNHAKTHLSDRLATLDKLAIGVGAFMTISPLFAAMIGRMAV